MRLKKSNPTISVIFMVDDLSLIAYEVAKTSLTRVWPAWEWYVPQNALRGNNRKWWVAMPEFSGMSRVPQWLCTKRPQLSPR
jgi:hypothetical protein